MIRRRSFQFGLAGTTALTAIAANTPSQVALVIGNNAYTGKGPAKLTNAVNDATLVHRTLEGMGVRSTLLTDLGSTQLASAIEQAIVSLRRTPADLFWFFYSGHGFGLDGKDYLIGTDLSLTTPLDLKTRAFDLDVLKGLLQQVRPRASVVVFDACRDNPFLARTRSLAGPATGATLKDWGGTLAAFSTAPFTKALDWPGRPNGPYAKALCDALKKNGSRSLEEALKEAADSVYRSTQKEQVPGFYSDLRVQISVEPSRIRISNAPSTGGDAGAVPAMSRSSRSMYRADLAQERIAITQADAASQSAWVRGIGDAERLASQMDAKETRTALRKARLAGSEESDWILAGLLLEAGATVPKDRQAAMGYYVRAASRGSVIAQTLAGELAYSRQQYAESYKWLDLAASSGFGRAKLDLAQLLMSGSGTPPNTDRAIQELGDVLRSVIPSFPITKP